MPTLARNHSKLVTSGGKLPLDANNGQSVGNPDGEPSHHSVEQQEPRPQSDSVRGGLKHKIAYSIKALAEETSISRATIYEHIRDGLLRPTKVGGRTIVRHDEVMRWLDSF